MPSNIVRASSRFEAGVSILASEIGLRSPRMLTLDLTALPATAPVALAPGTIIYKLPSGLGRAFPSAKATAATATSSKILTVGDPTLFKVGDVVTNAAGAAVGAIASIDLSAKTITLVANSAVAIAIGDGIITDPSTLGEAYGIIISQIDPINESNDVACYTSASVFGARLPFWNATLQTKFPEITLVAPAVVAPAVP